MGDLWSDLGRLWDVRNGFGSNGGKRNGLKQMGVFKWGNPGRVRQSEVWTHETPSTVRESIYGPWIRTVDHNFTSTMLGTYLGSTDTIYGP